MITLKRRNSDALLTAFCSADSAVGHAVRITGVELGTVTVAPVNPADPSQMPAYGLLVQKLSSTRCLVQRWGTATLPDAASLEPGRVCYVGLDATLTTTQPSAQQSPSGILVLQTVGLATDTSAVDFSPSPATLEISA